MTPTVPERLAALEQRELKLHDLPLKQLLDKLEQDWTPDARTLLLKKSVDSDKLADETIHAFVQLFTAADLKLKFGTITDWYTGNLAAATGSTIQPTAVQLGLATVSLCLLSAVPYATTDCQIDYLDYFTPQLRLRNGATAQKFDVHYVALGT
jgi:hypothetical protein